MNEFLLLKNKSAKLILLLGLDLYDRMSGSAQYWCKAVELKYQIYSNKPIGFGFVRLSVQKYPILMQMCEYIYKISIISTRSHIGFGFVRLYVQKYPILVVHCK